MKLNYKYKTWNYDELQEICQSLQTVKNKPLVFSIFTECEGSDPTDEKWLVQAPDINDKDPLISGKWLVKVGDWDKFELDVRDPCWSDIIRIAQMNDGHHIFLEEIEVDEEMREITLSMGT